MIVILACCHSGASINKSRSDAAEAVTRAAIEAFSGYKLDPNIETRSGELANSKFIVIAGAFSTEVGWEAERL